MHRSHVRADCETLNGAKTDTNTSQIAKLTRSFAAEISTAVALAVDTPGDDVSCRFAIIGDKWTGRSEALQIVAENAAADLRKCGSAMLLLLTIEAQPDSGMSWISKARFGGDSLIFLSAVIAPASVLLGVGFAAVGSGLVVAADIGDASQRRAPAPGSGRISIDEFVAKVRSEALNAEAVVCVVDAGAVAGSPSAREVVLKLSLLRTAVRRPMVIVLGADDEIYPDIEAVGGAWTVRSMPPVRPEDVVQVCGLTPALSTAVCELARGRAQLVLSLSAELKELRARGRLHGHADVQTALRQWARSYVVDALVSVAQSFPANFAAQVQDRVEDAVLSVMLLSLQGSLVDPQLLDSVGLKTARLDLGFSAGRVDREGRWLVELDDSLENSYRWRLPSLLVEVMRLDALETVRLARADGERLGWARDSAGYRIGSMVEALLSAANSNQFVPDSYLRSLAHAAGRTDLVVELERLRSEQLTRARDRDLHILARMLRRGASSGWDDHLRAASAVRIATVVSSSDLRPRRRDLRTAVATLDSLVRANAGIDVDTPLRLLTEYQKLRFRQGSDPALRAALLNATIQLQMCEAPLAFVPTPDLVTLASESRLLRHMLLMRASMVSMDLGHAELSIPLFLHGVAENAFGSPTKTSCFAEAKNLYHAARMLFLKSSGVTNPDKAELAADFCRKVALRTAADDPDPGRGAMLISKIAREAGTMLQPATDIDAPLLFRTIFRADDYDRGRLAALAVLLSRGRFDESWLHQQIFWCALADLLLRAERVTPREECLYWAFAADTLSKAAADWSTDWSTVAMVFHRMAGILARGRPNTNVPEELDGLWVPTGPWRCEPGTITFHGGQPIPLDAANRNAVFHVSGCSRIEDAGRLDTLLLIAAYEGRVPWSPEPLANAPVEVSFADALERAGRLVYCLPLDRKERDELLALLPLLIGSVDSVEECLR